MRCWAPLEALVDRWLDEDVIDIDTHRTGGLLEMSFPNGSKIVINTQPPLQEIWLAARGGGFHFRYCEGRWLDTRSSVEFHALLSEQASARPARRSTSALEQVEDALLLVLAAALRQLGLVAAERPNA